MLPPLYHSPATGALASRARSFDWPPLRETDCREGGTALRGALLDRRPPGRETDDVLARPPATGEDSEPEQLP